MLIRKTVSTSCGGETAPVCMHNIQEIREGNPAHLLLHVGFQLRDGGGHPQGPHDDGQLVQGCHVSRPIGFTGYALYKMYRKYIFNKHINAAEL